VPVALPPREAALAWLEAQGLKEAERWLAYAGGVPLRAVEYAARGKVALVPTDAREDLEPLAESLQKIALDHALLAFGLPAKYRTSAGPVAPEKARAWLAFARQMGEDRLLCRHPLNPRLFSAAMLAAVPTE
jgi:DNA polymerase III subunit delta'